MMVLTIDQKSSVGATLAEGEVVDSKDTRCRLDGDGYLTREAQQCGRAGGHRLAEALACTSFAAKRQPQLLERGRQAQRALGRPSEETGQRFGEGSSGAGGIVAAPAPQTNEETQSGANERKVTRFAGVITMNMAGFSGTGWAVGGGSGCSRCKQDCAGLCLQIEDGQSWEEEIQWVLKLHGSMSPSSFDET
jgi:hypothetical protein